MIVTGRSGQAAAAGGAAANSSAAVSAKTNERLIFRTSLLGNTVHWTGM
jgi:hypothetical protein